LGIAGFLWLRRNHYAPLMSFVWSSDEV
jgi:hypothetical protein